MRMKKSPFHSPPPQFLNLVQDKLSPLKGEEGIPQFLNPVPRQALPHGIGEDETTTDSERQNKKNDE